MTAREKFIDYVINGGDKPLVSLQIGAGAGFDCKLAGKEWISDGTLDDTINAYNIVGGDVLLNIALPDAGRLVPELAWHSDMKINGNNKIITSILPTPFGEISWKFQEQKMHGLTPLKYPLTMDSENVFDVVKWYAENYGKLNEKMNELIEPLIRKAQPHGAVSVQWNIQPFELMGLLSVENLAMLALINPEEYRRTCDLIRDVNIELIKSVFACDADFVFLGAPGVEMLSPQIYEDFIIPDSKIITDAIHNIGGLVYSHICSPIEPFLSNGYYNQMGIDLFETLSPPPVGNVENLAEARKILDDNICTRGNIGLDILLNASREEVEKETIKIIEQTRGSKHIIAASDYLFYDIPLENVKTVIQTVENYSGESQ